MLFQDRSEAGRVLAARLMQYAGRSNVVVLALPRGGVPVAYEVAKALGAPLDVFVVRKLGTPGQPELAMGAIASGGTVVLNPDVVHGLGIPDHVIQEVIRSEQQEIERRERQYRGDRAPIDVRGKTVILVDDGLATGSTMLAAVEALREKDPEEIIVAVPVASRGTCDEFRTSGQPIICAETPEPFFAVGQWYRDFSQTTDEEVRDLLDRANQQQPRAA